MTQPPKDAGKAQKTIVLVTIGLAIAIGIALFLAV